MRFPSRALQRRKLARAWRRIRESWRSYARHQTVTSGVTLVYSGMGKGCLPPQNRGGGMRAGGPVSGIGHFTSVLQKLSMRSRPFSMFAMLVA